MLKRKKKNIAPIQIKISNGDYSFVQIIGDYSPIKKFLRFKVENARFSPAFKSRHWDGYISLINKNRLMVGNIDYFCSKALSNKLSIEFFLNGSLISPEEVQQHLFGKIDYQSDKIHRILTDIPAGFDPREYQFDSVAAAMESTRGTIYLATGGGKSLILYLMSALLHDRAENSIGLIIVPRISLVEQLEQSIRLFSQNRIIPLTSIHHKESILELQTGDRALIVSTFQSWISWQDDEGLKLPKISYIIGDEAHTYAGKGSKSADSKIQGGVKKYATVFSEIPIRYGLTATPPDDELDKLQLTGLFGPPSYIKKAASLMKEGYLAKPNIYRFFIKHELQDTDEVQLSVLSDPVNVKLSELETEEKNIISELTSPDMIDIQIRLYRDRLNEIDGERSRQKGQLSLVKKDFLLCRHRRHEFILDLCIEFFKNGPILILGEKLDKHLVPLRDFIVSSGIKCLYLDRNSTAEERKIVINEMANPTENMVLTVTYGLFQMGIDIPTLSNVLMYSPSTSTVRVLQSIGRGLRPNSMCNVLDLIDYTNEIPESSKIRKKIYDSEYEDQYTLKDVRINL